MSSLIRRPWANLTEVSIRHGHRPANYSQFDYFGEFGVLVQALANDGQVTTRNNLIAPSVNTGPWTPESVWNTGFVASYSNSIGALSVEQ